LGISRNNLREQQQARYFTPSLFGHVSNYFLHAIDFAKDFYLNALFGRGSPNALVG
jgi:hypothetical protein